MLQAMVMVGGKAGVHEEGVGVGVESGEPMSVGSCRLVFGASERWGCRMPNELKKKLHEIARWELLPPSSTGWGTKLLAIGRGLAMISP